MTLRTDHTKSIHIETIFADTLPKFEDLILFTGFETTRIIFSARCGYTNSKLVLIFFRTIFHALAVKLIFHISTITALLHLQNHIANAKLWTAASFIFYNQVKEVINHDCEFQRSVRAYFHWRQSRNRSVQRLNSVSLNCLYVLFPDDILLNKTFRVKHSIDSLIINNKSNSSRVYLVKLSIFPISDSDFGRSYIRI